MHNLIILSKKAKEYRILIEAENLPDLHLIGAYTDPSQITAKSPCDILFGDPSLIREVLNILPELQWVQITWAGVEPLLSKDLRRDYWLTNARSVFGPLISEYVLAYLLAHERRVVNRYLAQEKHVWDATITGTLKGKIMGLLGVGSIGAYLATVAKQFGMHVRGFTNTSQSSTEVDQYFHGEDLQTFTNGLDYLINSLPNTPETRQLVNSQVLSWLPPHAFFINVGRGSTVDESALAAALTKRQLAGAALDVFEKEPLPPDHIFWTTPNLYISCHTAAPSFPKDIVELFNKNYQRYHLKLPLHHLVDFERGY